MRGRKIPRSLSPELTYLLDVANNQDYEELRYAVASDMAIDTTMTNLVRAYRFEDQVSICDTVAPIKPVRSRSGRWKTRGKEAVDIHVSDLAADRSETNEIGFAVGEQTYYIDTRRLKLLVTDEEAEERGILNAATEGVILLRHATLLRQEIRIRNLADATTNETTPGTDWDTSSVIHADVTAAKIAFTDLLGLPPTHIAFGDHVANEIASNADIKADIVTATNLPDGRGFINLIDGKTLPRMMWGLQVLVPTVMYNSAARGATRVLTRVWGDDAYMFRIDRSTRTDTWAIQPQTLAPTIVRWRNPDPGGWYYKLMMKRDEQELTSEAIHQLLDVT